MQIIVMRNLKFMINVVVLKSCGDLTLNGNYRLTLSGIVGATKGAALIRTWLGTTAGS